LKSIVLLITIVGVFTQAATVATAVTADPFAQFQQYITSFNKSFASMTDFTSTFLSFEKNLLTIASLNAANANNTFGHTQFSDMEPADFKKQYLSFSVDQASLNKAKVGGFYTNLNATSPTPMNSSASNDGHRFLSSSGETRNLASVPASYDWRIAGAVGPVKNQLQCGDCWAFATSGNMESQFYLKYGVLHNFSEQQLLDCATANSACNGGNMAVAMQYIMYSTGLETTYNYGNYLAYQKSCSSTAYLGLGFVKGWYFPGTNEVTIMNYVYTNGPLAVAVNADPLQYYTSGIINLNAASCSPTNLDHAVQIVGYGTGSGLPYWIVKNSWGAAWGEAGYFRIVRGYSVCGINGYVINAILN